MNFLYLTKVCDLDVMVEKRGLCVLLQGVFRSIILTSVHGSFHEAGALQSHRCFRKAHLTVLFESSSHTQLHGNHPIQTLQNKDTRAKANFWRGSLKVVCACILH